MDNVTSTFHPELSYTYSNAALMRHWQIMVPPVYRFIAQQYVDEFFNDGKLRLSSFKMFSKHADEQRRDVSEGWGFVVADGPGGGTLIGALGVGKDMYVLCGTTNFTKEMCQTFSDCDACFVIDNPLGFADAVSNRIPFFRMGLTGPAVYREGRAIRRSYDPERIKHLIEKHGIECSVVGEDIEITQNRYDNYPDEIKEELRKNLLAPESLFLKNSLYSHQSEYRIFWQSAGPVQDFIDISVPEAVQYCRRVSLLS